MRIPTDYQSDEEIWVTPVSSNPTVSIAEVNNETPLNLKYMGKIDSLDVKELFKEQDVFFKENDDGDLTMTCPFDSSHGEADVLLSDKSLRCSFGCGGDIPFEKLADLFPFYSIKKHCREKITVALPKNKKGQDEKFGEAEVANILLQRYDIVVDKNGLIFIYIYPIWDEISIPIIKKLILEIVTPKYFQAAYVNEILSIILAKCQSTIPIEWNKLPGYEIPLRNGIYNIKDRFLRSHKKDDYMQSVIGVNYNKNATTETFIPLLESWVRPCATELSIAEESDFVDAKKDMCTLQEFCGYILMPHAHYKKALLVYGDKDTGKSVFASLVTLVIGLEKVCSIPLNRMSDQSALAPIKNKQLILETDLPKDSLIADGGFKQIVSGGDPIQINEKYKKQQTIIPAAKILMVTNNLPRITDTTNAVFDRLLMLKFNNVVAKEDQDPELLAKLESEKEGVLLWMLNGARDIYMRKGVFTESDRAIKARNDYSEEENPLNLFMSENYVRSVGNVVAISSIRDLYREDSGNRKITSRYVAKTLRDKGYKTEKRNIESKKSVVVLDVKLITNEAILQSISGF